MKTIILIILLLSCSISVLAQWSPLYLPLEYPFVTRGEWNTDIMQWIPDKILVTATLFDTDGDGYKYTLLNNTGRVYPLEPQDKWVRQKSIGRMVLYYPYGFNSGSVSVPAPVDPTASHMIEIQSFAIEPGQWMLQIDPEWNYKPYGTYKNSTIGRLGCYGTTIAMQLTYWGLPTLPPDLIGYLNSQKDGYAGSNGWNINNYVVLRYTKSRGVKYKFVSNMTISECQDRGIPCSALFNSRQHFALAYGKYINNGKKSNLIYDPMGRTIHDDGWYYYGLQERNTRVFCPKVNPILPFSISSAKEDGDINNSGIIVFTTMEPMGMSLKLITPTNNTIVGKSIMYDDGKQYRDKLSLECNEAPYGNYTISIAGWMASNTYAITVWEYNMNGDFKETNYSGKLGSTCKVDISIIHGE